MTVPICILILGMHRSGSSALAGALAALGASLPKHLVAEAPDNPKGFSEPRRIVEINDQLMSELRTHYTDWQPIQFGLMIPARLDSFRREIGRIIQEEYPDPSLIVLKDPRISRFLPLYIPLIQSLGFDLRIILNFRAPFAVARSLAARDGISIDGALLCWLAHTLASEHETRTLKRCGVEYDKLLSHPNQTLNSIRENLKLEFPITNGNAVSTLDLSLNRQDSSYPRNTLPMTAEWATRAFHTLRGSPTGAPSERGARQQLDILRGYLNSLADATGSYLRAQTTLLADERDWWAVRAQSVDARPK